MGNRTNYGTGRMTVDNRQKNERSRSGNPYSSHVKAGKHAGTVYNFKRKSRIRKSLTRLPILLEFIHKYIFLNFVSFYNGLNSNDQSAGVVSYHRWSIVFTMGTAGKKTEKKDRAVHTGCGRTNGHHQGKNK